MYDENGKKKKVQGAVRPSPSPSPSPSPNPNPSPSPNPNPNQVQGPVRGVLKVAGFTEDMVHKY